MSGEGNGTRYRVCWTRGPGCLPVADALGGSEAFAAEGDLRRFCIAKRVDLLVATKFTSFELVPTVVPQSVDLDSIGSVTAAVADGPHSPLAASIAVALGSHLGLEQSIVTGYRHEDERTAAEERLEAVGAGLVGVRLRAIAADNAADLIDALDNDTLLVIGAPGGSWFHRQLFGPGHRLVVGAPAGAVLVRSAPRRCFHDSVDPASYAIGAEMSVGAAAQVVHTPTAPVTDHGKLIGIVRSQVLARSNASSPVSAVMEPPVAVQEDEPAEVAADLNEFLESGPVPVVDAKGILIGVIVETGPGPLG